MQSRQLSVPAEGPNDPIMAPWPDEIGPEEPAPALSRAARLRGSLRRRSTLLNAGLVVLIAAGGFWGYTMVHGTGSAGTTGQANAGRQATVAARTVTQTVSTSGSVASSDVVSANFTTAGTVTKIYVKLGQSVTKGQELARVDPTAADEQLKTAQDNLTVAEDSLTRAKDSGDTTSIDTAQQQVDTAQDAVTSAQAAVDGVVLTAPIAGVVIAQNGTVGAASSSTSSSSGSSGSGGSGASGFGGSGGGSSSTSSSSSSAFIQIADMTKMEVDTDFPEADATKLAVGMPAEITWNALTGATATGKVASIDPTATTSNNVVSYGVVVDLTSLPTGIRIGQSTTVTVTTATKDNVLAVPNAAVTGTGTTGVVTVLKNGVSSRAVVGLGLVGDTYTEITSGLTAGEIVVLPTVNTSGTTTNTNPFGGGGGGLFGGGGGGFTPGGGGGAFRGGGTGGRGGAGG